MEGSQASGHGCLRLQAAGSICLIDLAEVLEITTDRLITPLPRPQRAALGLNAYRGSLRLVLDTAVLLGVLEQPRSRAFTLMLRRFAGIGLAVDAVEAIATASGRTAPASRLEDLLVPCEQVAQNASTGPHPPEPRA